MCKTLVVIDMQHCFLHNFDEKGRRRIIRNVQKAIRNAIDENIPILNVQYDPARLGGTILAIQNVWAGYPNVTTIEKSDDDGSCEVLDKHPHGPFMLCGINLSACVRATANGLYDNSNENIQVIRKATANPHDWGKNYAQRTIEEFEAQDMLV